MNIDLFEYKLPFFLPQTSRVLIFGGALNTNCNRDKLISYLSSKNKYLTLIPDKINYFDISSSKYNLVQKETRLFENADKLIIIPESPGSFAELGMITSMINNPHDHISKKKYASKLLILMDQKFKYDDSFLKLGPLKSIKASGGDSINIDFNLNNYSKIDKYLIFNKTKKINLRDSSSNSTPDLFFVNSIKILIYVFSKKSLKFYEQEYLTKFIESLKKIHYGIEIDNVEYLESIELIIKKNIDGYIFIEVNHNHAYIKELIDLNLEYFLRKKILRSFFKESGY